MRRGRRQKKGDTSFKYVLYLSGGVLLILVITFVVTFISYNNKLKSSSEGLLALDQISVLVPNDNNESTESIDASSEMGKTINEVINSMENTTNAEQNNAENNQSNTTNSNNEINQGAETKVEKTETKAPEKIKDPEFTKPVEGEISRDFAKDNLVFSETLQEWVVHQGVDIKADRMAVVKAAEVGTVKAIKNDPRYGLTIIVEHVNGFKTVYSNLLTTEFVTEGEKVEKGQSLGTVGNSAAFEIVDEPHLHFEILKDDVTLDPKIYI